MKLSEMNGEQLIQCICMIAEPVERIAKDAEFFNGLFSCMQIDGDKLRINKARIALHLLPYLLKHHRDDALLIAGVLNGKSLDDMLAQNGLSTLRDIKNCFDPALLSFFGSSGSAE